MTFHIVRMNEKIEKIALNYQLDIEEIKEVNKYIKDWNHLIPGTKLRLPEISTSLNEEIDQDEPFIEEYYPKLNEHDYQHFEEEIVNVSNNNLGHDTTNIVDEKQNVNHNEENIAPLKHPKVKQEMVLPNYPNFYPYPNYYYQYPYLTYQNRNLRKPTKRK